MKIAITIISIFFMIILSSCVSKKIVFKEFYPIDAFLKENPHYYKTLSANDEVNIFYLVSSKNEKWFNKIRNQINSGGNENKKIFKLINEFVKTNVKTPPNRNFHLRFYEETSELNADSIYNNIDYFISEMEDSKNLLVSYYWDTLSPSPLIYIYKDGKTYYPKPGCDGCPMTMPPDSTFKGKKIASTIKDSL